MGDSAVIWAFYLGTLYVYMNPLWVESCISKLIDTFLVYLQPL